MDRIFLNIVNMSITSSYVILCILMARPLLKKTSRTLTYCLWGIPFLRLIFPFSIQSIFSLISINTKTIPEDIVYAHTPKINSGIKVIDSAVNRVLPDPMVGASMNPIQIWILLGEIIWLSGLGILIIYSIYSTTKLSKNLRTRRLLYNNIYETANIKTPFVFGIISPKIYLPTNLSEGEKSYIIKHEETHIKRFDHLIKFIFYIILCIHWFNPLAWLAFSLMNKDMELSCDEMVIKEMGNGIKKDYSNSLLSLSTGRRIVGGSPLAFGENNIKTRIRSILNYKRPKFWIVFMGIIALIVLAIGLLSNPKEQDNVGQESEILTVEDYAKEFINRDIKNYTDPNGPWNGFRIIDSKITKLEKIEEFENILTNPIEIWSLEYRLKPDDISKVIMAGGMTEIDGWITENTSMGKPILVFSREENGLKFIGSFYTGEMGIETLVTQEIAIRNMLQQIGLLGDETYKGDHVVIEFTLPNKEKGKLLLSQPIIQGDKGIWVVERWMDANGYIYLATPHTDLRIEEYYNNLQNEFEIQDRNKRLGDPLEVGYDFLLGYFGDIGLKKEDLMIIEKASIEDFLESPISHYIGFISDLNLEDDFFHFNRIEISNSYPDTLFLTDDTEYVIKNLKPFPRPEKYSKKDLIEYLSISSDRPIFNVYIKGGFVIKVEEN